MSAALLVVLGLCGLLHGRLDEPDRLTPTVATASGRTDGRRWRAMRYLMGRIGTMGPRSVARTGLPVRRLRPLTNRPLRPG
ncbi:hypothetical protein [Streptomyces sp. NPDC096132]|uniref:hypothetical protein n=1 Tax=Streptomyces sp. NPDC096132 TaxID=3366075 RepID=UPI00380F888E